MKLVYCEKRTSRIGQMVPYSSLREGECFYYPNWSMTNVQKIIDGHHHYSTNCINWCTYQRGIEDDLKCGYISLNTLVLIIKEEKLDERPAAYIMP